MIGTEEYAIDSSSLIEGLRKTYPKEVFPSLWNKVGEQIEFGKIVAPDEVKRELEDFVVDELAKWCNGFPNFFQPEDADIQNVVTSIMAHPEHRKLMNLKTPSRYCADMWVIAIAKVRKLTVINEEQLLTSVSPHKNKIPNVCRDLGVPYMNFLDYIRKQNWQF
ncbi:MAG: DUF4411 family protein [Pyrinomonadaceae bacterium]|nr:DUF4411 family protein [Pyrinomonadaceae bacterium]